MTIIVDQFWSMWQLVSRIRFTKVHSLLFDDCISTRQFPIMTKRVSETKRKTKMRRKKYQEKKTKWKRHFFSCRFDHWIRFACFEFANAWRVHKSNAIYFMLNDGKMSFQTSTTNQQDGFRFHFCHFAIRSITFERNVRKGERERDTIWAKKNKTNKRKKNIKLNERVGEGQKTRVHIQFE